MRQVQQTVNKFTACRQRQSKSFLSWLPSLATSQAHRCIRATTRLLLSFQKQKVYKATQSIRYTSVVQGPWIRLWQTGMCCFAQALLRFKWHFGSISKVGHYFLLPIVVVRGKKKVTHVCLLWSLNKAMLTKWNKLNDNFYGADLERTSGIMLNTCSYHTAQKVYSSPV